MRSSLAWLLTVMICLLASCVGPNVAQFSEPWSPRGWSVEVILPGKPKKKSETLESPIGRSFHEFFGVDRGGVIWSASRLKLPMVVPPEKKEKVYKGGLRGMMRNTPGKVLKQSKWSLGKEEGWKYEVRRDNGRSFVVAHLLLADELYQFGIDADQVDQMRSKVFFGSIRLKD